MPYAHTIKANGKRKCEDLDVHKPKTSRKGTKNIGPRNMRKKRRAALAEKRRMDAAQALLGLG